MTDTIYLKKGAIYFYVGFMDEELTIPCIDTWIYVEHSESDGHIFQSASERDEKFCFPNEIHSNVLDHNALSIWLLEEHSPTIVAREYVYESV